MTAQRRLALLMRIQKQQVDETRRRLMTLESEMDTHTQRLRALTADVQQQKFFTANNPSYAHTWRDYLTTAQRRETEILRHITRLNHRIVRERATMRNLFRTLKAYELGHENLVAQAFADANYAEQMALDEMATTRYTRNMHADNKD